MVAYLVGYTIAYLHLLLLLPVRMTFQTDPQSLHISFAHNLVMKWMCFFHIRQITVAYVSATSSALVVSLGLKNLLAKVRFIICKSLWLVGSW